MAEQDHQWLVQARIDLVTGTMASHRCCGDRHAGMGRLVQQARIMELIGNVPPVEREAAYYGSCAVV